MLFKERCYGGWGVRGHGWWGGQKVGLSSPAGDYWYDYVELPEDIC